VTCTISAFGQVFLKNDSLIVSETEYHDAIRYIHKAMGSLGLNVNEELLLQSLFLQCPSLMMLGRIITVN